MKEARLTGISSSRNKVSEVLLVFLLFALLSVALTWPVAANLGSGLPQDLVDPLLTSWMLAWGPHALAESAGVWDAPIFHPAQGAFAFTENLLGLAIPLAPIWFLTKDAALLGGVALLLCFALNATTAFFLFRATGGGRLASIVGASVFAFAPYRMSQITHLHVEASYLMPLVLLALVRIVRTPSWRWSIAFGVLLAAQVWTSLNVGAVTLLAAVIAGVCLLLTAAPRDRLKSLLMVVAGIGIAAVLITPMAIEFLNVREQYGIEVETQELALYSADIQSFLTVPPWHVALGDATSKFRTGPWSEQSMYPGFAVLILSMLGLMRLWRADRSIAVTAGAIGLVSVVVAFGPTTGSGTKLPYGYAVDILPSLSMLRVPTRMWLAALLALGWLAAFGMSALRGRRVLPVVAVLLIAAEYIAVPVPIRDVPQVPEEYAELEAIDGAMLELPALVVSRSGSGFLYDPQTIDNETFAMYRQSVHFKPIVNGYSSHLPETYLSLMESVRKFPAPDVLRKLEGRGVRWVLIHPEELDGSPWEDLTNRLQGLEIVRRDPDLILIRLTGSEKRS